MVQNTPQGTPNPLQKYFRTPAIYVKLPSGGRGYPAGTIDMPENGELPVYPMTAMDEVLARTPDALYNGSATVDVFKSCVPNIKEPWNILQSDVDLLLLAIRVASYGHEMDMNSTCPNDKCKQENSFTVDLRVLIDSIQNPNYDKSFQIDDLIIYFKSLNYRELNQNSIAQFQEQKALAVSESEDLDDVQRADLLRKSLESLTRLTLESLTQSIDHIRVGDTVVNDPKQILEFLQNAKKEIFEPMRDHLAKIRTESQLKPVSITCPECGNKYEQPFVLDQSNFFV